MNGLIRKKIGGFPRSGFQGVLSLQPDDVLVLMYDKRLKPEIRTKLREAMQREFPGRRCIVLDSGIKLGVIRAADQADEAVILHGNAAKTEALDDER